MKIDRHNYEEYFILYWDNELTAVQKQAVEEFVQQNPDVQEEFRVFGETRFIPDGEKLFADKEFLQTGSAVNITNIEERLLSYIDDELSAEEEKAVEKYAAHYPAVKKELEILQRTKLQPETEIVFADKSVLYRREEKTPVISMTWFRVAVAAAIILIAGFATLRFLNNGKQDEEIPFVDAGKGKTNPAISTDSKKDIPATDEEKKKDELAKQEPPVADKKEKENKKPPVENLAVNKTKPENKNNLPREGSGIKTKTNPDANTITSDIAAVDIPNLKQKDFTAAEKYKTELTANPNVTIQPGYALNLQEPANDKEVTANNQKEKGGLKEFLRKTTRVFERRTNVKATTDDNKLLVGAFAVSLK